MKYNDMLRAKLRRYLETEREFGMARQRRALDRLAHSDDRALRITDRVIAALIGGLVTAIILTFI